jgi:hypothetical protein
MTKCYVLWNRISVGESKEKQKEILESIIKELNKIYERRAKNIAEFNEAYHNYIELLGMGAKGQLKW